MRWRTGLFAALCALASFDVLADPAAQAFEMWFFGVAGGCLACVAVELAAGKARWPMRLAMGVLLAIVNAILYLACIGVLIRLPVGSFIPLMLAAWILPAARLWWLRRAPAKGP